MYHNCQLLTAAKALKHNYLELPSESNDMISVLLVGFFTLIDCTCYFKLLIKLRGLSARGGGRMKRRVSFKKEFAIIKDN